MTEAKWWIFNAQPPPVIAAIFNRMPLSNGFFRKSRRCNNLRITNSTWSHGETEPPSHKPRYFNREDIGSRVSHHPAWINRRREDLSSTLILSILSDSPSSPAEMISCVIKLLALRNFFSSKVINVLWYYTEIYSYLSFDIKFYENFNQLIICRKIIFIKDTYYNFI